VVVLKDIVDEEKLYAEGAKEVETEIKKMKQRTKRKQ
jgi:hypothetical protein